MNGQGAHRCPRAGFAVHELLISLTILGGVMALATHFSLGQLRFFRGVADVTGARSQLGQATEVVASLLWSASPRAGDLVAVQDSLLEVRMATGTAVVCASTPGAVTVPRPAGAGNTLGAFVRTPAPGDVVAALFSDSSGSSWLTFRVAAAPVEEEGCPVSTAVQRTWRITLAEPLAIPSGTVLRFLRPLRVSLYRASDNRWYLGARDWNGALERFNSVQPLAGPLRPWSANPDSTGLRIVCRDSAGAILLPPVDPSLVFSVTLIARSPVSQAGLSRPADGSADSAVVTVALRNAR